MKVCTVISVATLYIASTGLAAHATSAGYLRRHSQEAPRANASPMLRGFALTEADHGPAYRGITSDQNGGETSNTTQETSAQGVSWVPSDFRTGKVSLLPTFPPSASATPVMSPSPVPAASSVGVTWMPSDFRTGKVSLLPTFPPQPTPASTTLVQADSFVGVTWMPSDLGTGNVTLLPLFSHQPASEDFDQVSHDAVPRNLPTHNQW